MNPFIKIALWFLGIPALGLILISLGGIEDTVFSTPWKNPNLWTILGGVIFYAGLFLDGAYIGRAWYNTFKRDK